MSATPLVTILRQQDSFRRDFDDAGPFMNSFFSNIAPTPAEEAIEVAALMDWHRACAEHVRRAVGFDCLAFDKGCAISLPGAKGAVFNRIFGLPTVDELEAACRWMDAKPGTKYLQLDLEAASDEVRRWFLAKGLSEQGHAWAKLVRTSSPEPQRRTSAMVCRRVELKEASLFGSIICAGFGLSETLIPVWASVVERAGWTCFFALDGNRPIGTGTMFTVGDDSWLGAGTVLPAFASRGAHKALIGARVAKGVAGGSSRFAVEATFSASSAINVSFDNLKKMGFEHAYSRSNFALP